MLGGSGRGRGRGAPPGFQAEAEGQDSFRGFREASREIEENLSKHLDKQLEEMSDSDSDVDSDGADELLDRVLDSYCGSGPDTGLLAEAKELLKNAIQSSVCLICISSVRRTDPIWSCGTCYVSFHINCIQRWAKDTIFQQKQQLEGDPERQEKERRVCWSCPKCRADRPAGSIPAAYRCYCGRAAEPEWDPWQTPHSSATPGPARPARRPSSRSATVARCRPHPPPRQAGPVTRRCSAAAWSCGQPCGQDLACRTHACPATCHPGECLPCDRTSVQSCECRKTREPRPCSAPAFKCGHPCGALLACGFHSCDLICHPAGPCPPCPLSLDRQCPCGKAVVRLPCTEATPTCGDTCGKLLGCGSHSCSERCHRGSCPSCLQMKVKQCRCGARQKEVQCAKTFSCELKCKKTRDCQRHACNKKCCTGSCPPCEQMCGKTLSCKNHKCLSRCHRGACYPCQATMEVRCNCGATKTVVPCGRERATRPPRCRKPCPASPDCHHPGRAPHTCHPGACPGCKFVCGDQQACGHPCEAACHDNITVRVEETVRAGPWEERGPDTEVRRLECPPCQRPLAVTCLGGHETADWPCHAARPAPCGRPCGRHLACGNHVCERDCHKVRHAGDPLVAGSNCRKCESDCQVAREAACPHPCPLPCHQPPCPTCTTLVKMKCHCGISNLLRKCGEFQRAEGKEKVSLLCCNDQCPKLLECSHRCSQTCHPGACSASASVCRKKVKLACPCRRRKEEFRCNQTAGATVVCDAACHEARDREDKDTVKANKSQENEDQLRNQREAELFERRLEGGGKKKRRNRKTETLEDTPSFLTTHKYYIAGIALLAFVSMILYWH